jgi:hypothetical protein
MKMNKAELVFEQLRDYCKSSTGTDNTWQGKSGTYKYEIGRPTANGTINGVIRKLAGIEASGNQIWVVAGSIKVDLNGEWHRGTGLPRAMQKEFTQTAVFLYEQQAKAKAQSAATVTV